MLEMENRHSVASHHADKRFSAGIGVAGLSMLIVLLFGYALLTSRLGLHAFLGAFFLGVMCHRWQTLVREWKNRVEPLVSGLFLPIFFAYTGLRTDVSGLE